MATLSVAVICLADINTGSDVVHIMAIWPGREWTDRVDNLAIRCRQRALLLNCAPYQFCCCSSSVPKLGGRYQLSLKPCWYSTRQLGYRHIGYESRLLRIKSRFLKIFSQALKKVKGRECDPIRVMCYVYRATSGIVVIILHVSRKVRRRDSHRGQWRICKRVLLPHSDLVLSTYVSAT